MNRYDDIVEVSKFNPFHDHLGRFSSSQGMSTFSANPKTKAGQKAIWRSAAAKYGDVGNVHRESKGETIGQNAAWIATGVKPKNLQPAKKPQPKPEAKPAEEKPTSGAKQITHQEAIDTRKQLGQDRDSLTKEEYDAMGGYIGTGNSFKINKKLRASGGDLSSLSPKDRKAIETIESKSKPAPTDMKLLRKSSDAELTAPLKKLGLDIDLENLTPGDIKKMVGKVVVKDDMTSTGFSDDGNCFKGRPVTFNFNCPKGKNVLFSPKENWKGNVAESEVVLGRKLAYKITGVRQEKNKWGEVDTIVDADILPD